jgi:hypothetical protein
MGVVVVGDRPESIVDPEGRIGSGLDNPRQSVVQRSSNLGRRRRIV